MKHWHADPIEATLENGVERVLRRQRRWEYAQAIGLGVVSAIAIYWLGIGW
jgi:hypothetical protein